MPQIIRLRNIHIKFITASLVLLKQQSVHWEEINVAMFMSQSMMSIKIEVHRQEKVCIFIKTIPQKNCIIIN